MLPRQSGVCLHRLCLTQQEGSPVKANKTVSLSACFVHLPPRQPRRSTKNNQYIIESRGMIETDI